MKSSTNPGEIAHRDQVRGQGSGLIEIRNRISISEFKENKREGRTRSSQAC